MLETTYKFIDLFSGCGGFSTGLEMAGHKCLLGVDFQKEAVQTFAKNHPQAHALHMDIHKLTRSELKKYIDFDEVDMVVGGPPCQGFSTVGRGQVDDKRNSLFEQFVRIVKLTNPKIVIFENVTGILANKNVNVLKKIFSSFETLGYQMDAQVMSAELYGVPSKRRRAIIMGVKGGEPSYPAPLTLKQAQKNNVKSAFRNLKAKDGEIYNHELNSAKIANQIDVKRLKRIPPGAGIRYQKDELAFLPKSLRFDVDWETMSENRFRQTRLYRLPWESPAPTILTSRTTYYHPEEPRYLTVREAAKLQSFPNNFVFEGSLTAQFRQIGNAVPPFLAKKIGEEIKRISFSKRRIKKFTLDKRDVIAKDAFDYKDKSRRLAI